MAPWEWPEQMHADRHVGGGCGPALEKTNK